MSEYRACDGDPTIQDGEFQECAACGMRVRWDFVEHSLFGFTSACSQRRLEELSYG